MINQYIKIAFSDGSVGYQVIQNGNVISFVDEAGTFLFDVAPIGLGSTVIDASPEIQPWMT